MSATAAHSREIESNVSTLFSNGTRVQNCGLIITKAKYGLIALEKQRRSSHAVHSLVRSNTADAFTERPSPRMDVLRRIHSAKSAESSSTLGLSPQSVTADTVTTDAVTTDNTPNGGMSAEMEYTIDVTDALQCQVVHRGAKGGYMLIDDNVDKSKLDGFYDPCPWIQGPEDRILEIEYLFNRKYHYTEIGHLEHCRIPDAAHIVHVVDQEVVDLIERNEFDQEFARSEGSMEDFDEKTDSTRSALVDRTGKKCTEDGDARSLNGSAEDLSFAMATYSPRMGTIPSYESMYFLFAVEFVIF